VESAAAPEPTARDEEATVEAHDPNRPARRGWWERAS